MTRQRAAIPFGGRGLLRGTGVLTTEPARLADVQNVSLRPGRTARAPVLKQTVSQVANVEAFLAIHPMRALGETAILVLRAGAVRLLRMAPTEEVREVGVVWTLPNGAPFPRVSVTDVWDTLIIAHDEPAYGLRLPTRIFRTRPSESITDLTAQLAATGSVQPLRFRGVTRYLTYLVGWGYGTEVTGDENRPEIVRLSLPDDPTAFVPEHYFIAGQRGDPVLGCWPHGEGLAVRKATESYTIVGSDRPSFGILPADTFFGVASSRLAVTVGDRNFYWSYSGPRVSQGGVSADAALVLDVDGFGLDAIDPGELEDGVAGYDPAERVVLFAFNARAFALHLDTDEWTVRVYDRAINALGVQVRDAVAIQTNATVAFSSATAPAAALGQATTTGTVVGTVGGTVVGGEVIEVWGRPQLPGAEWTRLAFANAVAGANTVTTPWGKLGVTYDVALRLTLNGIPAAGSGSSNPLNWPSAARGTRQVPLPPVALVGGGVPSTTRFAERLVNDVFVGVLQVAIDAPPPEESHLEYDLRWSPDGGGADVVLATLPAADSGDGFGRHASGVLLPVRHSLGRVAVRARTAELTGPWSALSAVLWAGTSPPSGLIVGTDGAAPPNTRHRYRIFGGRRLSVVALWIEAVVEALRGGTWQQEQLGSFLQPPPFPVDPPTQFTDFDGSLTNLGATAFRTRSAYTTGDGTTWWSEWVTP